MPRNQDITTKYRLDVSEFKKGIAEANHAIKLANAEFNKSSATMDDWSKSTDGIKAKLTQLSSILKQQEKMVDNYVNEQNEMNKAYQENGKRADELRKKLQELASQGISKTSDEYKEYKKALDDVEKEQQKNKKASETMAITILNAQANIEKTKKEINHYKNALEDLNDESKDAKKNTADLADSLEKAGNEAEESSGGFSILKGAIASLIADGVKKAIQGFKDLAFEGEKASNKLQASIGATKEEMQGFNEEMNRLYSDDYGESLEDIADKMAYVKQATGEVDPSKIGMLVENAMTLEDTFGSDFNETIRGVSNLMTHFGLDVQKAFDLFAKGSQEGLDYTSELGDNVTEYSGNFKQAGYTAEEYFQLLANGSKSGAYNLDKVNDSINEVKNRLGDGTIKENLGSFSKDTKEAFKNWEKGKGTMKSVIDSIVKDISKCKSEQKALTMAQIAFGTMGEDANLNVVKSLNTLGDTFKDTKGTMEELKEIRYDDVETNIHSIGRTVITSLSQPIKKEVLPAIKQLINGINWEALGRKISKGIKIVVDIFKWLVDNKSIIMGAISGILAVFAVNKIASFATVLGSIIKTFTSAPSIIAGVTSAMKALNITTLANPYVALAAAITAVVAALAVWAVQSDETYQSIKAEKEAAEDQTRIVEENKKAWEDLNEAKKENINSGLNELQHYQNLYDELTNIVDANGKVKKGYEGRASFITSTLKDALGIEINMVDGVIQNYKKLTDSFDKVMQKKKAMIILEAQEEGYKKAINEKATILQNQNALEQEMLDLQIKRQEVVEQMSVAHGGFQAAMAQKELENVEKTIEEKQKQYDTQEEMLREFNTTIGLYEQNAALAHEEKYDKMTTYNAEYVENLKTNQDQQKALIQSQLEDERLNLQMLLEQKKKSNSDIYDEQIKSSEKQIKKLQEDLKTYTSSITTGNKEAAENWKIGLANQLAEATGKKVEFKEAGNGKVQMYIDGVKQGEPKAEKEMSEFVKKTINKINDKKLDAEKAGENLLEGTTKGIKNQEQQRKAFSAINIFGNSLLNNLRKSLQEHSPSKATEKMGQFLLQGLGIGVDKEENSITKKIANFGKGVLSNLKETLNEDIPMPALTATVAGNLQRLKSAKSLTTTVHEGGNAQATSNINYTQIINAPKSPSRVEVYRDTRRLLKLKEGK